VGHESQNGKRPMCWKKKDWGAVAPHSAHVLAYRASLLRPLLHGANVVLQTLIKKLILVGSFNFNANRMVPMPLLKEGQKAPLFSLPNQDGKIITLSESAGKIRILYFYPKDSTPGCTTEACNFRDSFNLLKKKGVEVWGLSKDSQSSHQKFRTNQSLNFDLLSDVEGVVCEKYGVWQEKKNYGKTYMGIVRSTFLIGPDGKIIKAWYGVKVAGHVEQVLSQLP